MHIKELLDYGVPNKIVDELLHRGFKELYPPQEQAIRSGVLDGKNLVIATPTASGKTLIALLAAAVNASRGFKTLYLTPLKAVASEKYEDMKLCEAAGFRVAISTGDYDSSDPWLKSYDIIVTTNEKADSLMRHSAPWLRDVNLVVADEIHLINSPERGPTLELLLTKLKRVRKGVQILGLSATISNADEIAEWLDAEVVVSGWRPVPLKEGVYYNGIIYFKDGEEKRIKQKYGKLGDLVADTLSEGGQVLIFRSTRRLAMSTASKLALISEKYLNRSEKEELSLAANMLRRNREDRITQKLADNIVFGSAFHHAGLSLEARKTVENLFRNRVLKVIAATPTLAAGVNVPARRVIIPDLYRFNYRYGISEPIPVMEYKQFAGRAGRPGYDEYGEAILVASRVSMVRDLMETYVLSEPERIRSRLDSERALRSHILALFATETVSDEKELSSLLSETFFARTLGRSRVDLLSRSVYMYLISEGFIEKFDGRTVATALGRRVSELYIDPASAEIIIDLLKKMSEPKTLAYLQIIARTEDMPKLIVSRKERRGWETLFEAFSDEMHPSLRSLDYYDYEDYYNALAEFKTAMLIHDWINEVSEEDMVERFNIGPGDIYNYVQSARWVCYAAYELAKLMGFDRHVKPLSILYKRIEHGVKEELVELVGIPDIGRVRARILYNAGYRNIEDLARAAPEKLSLLPQIGLETAKKIISYIRGTPRL